MAWHCHDIYHSRNSQSCHGNSPLCCLPDSILLEVLSYADAVTLVAASRVSRRWYLLTHDEQLWRSKVINRWGLKQDAVTAGELSWWEEYKRLDYKSPVMWSETLTEHTDEVLHVSFAHRGHLFATTSKDCSIKVWEVGYPTRLRHSRDFSSEYGWDFTQFSAFNAADTMLMVSSVCGLQDRRGYVAVLAINDEFDLLRVVSMDPSQLFGTWLDEWTVLGGSLELNLDRYVTSVQIEAFRITSADHCREGDPLVETGAGFSLFTFCSETASLIKFLTVVEEGRPALTQSESQGDIQRHVTPGADGLCPTPHLHGHVAQQVCDASATPQCRQLDPLPNSFIQSDSGTSHSQTPPCNGHAVVTAPSGEDHDDDSSLPHRTPDTAALPSPWKPSGVCPGFAPDSQDSVIPCAKANFSSGRMQEVPETSVHSLNQTGNSGLRSSSHASAPSCSHKLIYVTGEFAVSLHQIGVKSIPSGLLESWRKGELDVEGGLGEDSHMVVNYSSHDISLRQPRPPDHSDLLLDFNGHVTGLCLTRDHRYLIVNCRPWTGVVDRRDPWNTPELSGDMEVRVIDLGSFCEVGPRYKGHRGFSESDKCCFVFLDASRDFIASGSEDSRAYLWDRHHTCLLASLPHGAGVVNAVAFCPCDQEYLVSVSDDNTVRIWRSRQRMRALQPISTSVH